MSRESKSLLPSWLCAALSRGAVTTLRTPSGRRISKAPGDAFVRVEEAGFYEAHVSGGGRRSLAFAANPAIRESDPEPLDADAYVAGIRSIGTAAGGKDGDVGEATIVSADAWWFLLLACILLLALDTFFSNRLSRPIQAS